MGPPGVVDPHLAGLGQVDRGKFDGVGVAAIEELGHGNPVNCPN